MINGAQRRESGVQRMDRPWGRGMRLEPWGQGVGRLRRRAGTSRLPFMLFLATQAFSYFPWSPRCGPHPILSYGHVRSGGDESTAEPHQSQRKQRLKLP